MAPTSSGATCDAADAEGAAADTPGAAASEGAAAALAKKRRKKKPPPASLLVDAEDEVLPSEAEWLWALLHDGVEIGPWLAG